MRDEKTKAPRRISRSALWWGLAAAFSGVILVLILRLALPPYHVFSIVQKTGQNLVLVSARVGEIETEFDDAPLMPHADGTPPTKKMRRFLIQEYFGEARVELRFRYAEESRIHQLIGVVDTRLNFECEFLLIIRPDRLETGECGSRTDHYIIR